jgi:hypothetical protein
MAIHYYDKNGTRAQFADRNALVDALRRDLISGDTKVFVPAKNDFVPLKDVFDIQRLRDGDTTRKKADAASPQASPSPDPRREPPPSRPAKSDQERPSPPARATPKARAPASKNNPSVGVIVGVLVAAAIGGVLIQRNMDARQAKEAQARRQMADDLSQVTAQIRSGLAEKPASAAAPGEAASAAPSAPLKSPVAVLISEHLAQVQALSSAHEKEIDSIAGDQLMTPESLATRAGIAANRQKLAAMARSIDGYFAAIKQSKQDYLHRAEALGAKPTPARDEKMRRVFEFLERAHQANLHMVRSMGEMNDFASQHPPTLQKGALVFNSQTDLARWRQLSGSLLDDQKLLQRLESEGRQIESSSADELQQQVGKLRQPG